MFVEEMNRFIPKEWAPMDIVNDRYTLIRIPEGTWEYNEVYAKFQGVVNMGPIYRVQNPFLYTKFCMKCNDYEKKDYFQTLELFHDTLQSNVESICLYNIDWRFGERSRFGPGVYFSNSSFRANRRSTKEGDHRAMFLFDVLIGSVQTGRFGEFLPDPGYDTVVSKDQKTFVKYFDNEYYPKYVQYYTAL